MSEFDKLNPTRGTVVSGLAGAVSTYEPYDATITLTFKNRQERAEWIQKNSEQVYQIAVANTINQNRVYNKKCAITSFEFVENPYTNGIQTVLTLKLFGKWQSSLKEIEINSGTYSGGTKSYYVDVPVREIGEGTSGVAGEPEEDGRVPYTHTAWSWSSDGKDRFTAAYPRENVLKNTKSFAIKENALSGIKLTDQTYNGLPVGQIVNTGGDSAKPWGGGYVEGYRPDFYKIPTDTDYAVGFYAKASVDKLIIFNYFYGPNTVISAQSSTDSSNTDDGSVSITLTTEWKWYWIKWHQTPPTSMKSVIFGRLMGDKIGTVFMTPVVMVAGTKVPEIYTPAPTEDPLNAYPTYRGEYTDYTEADSHDQSVYTWGTPRVKKSYAYDSGLRYGVTHYVSAIKLNGERGFVLETEPRNGGLTVNLQSDYNGHQFALESNWPNLITGLSSEFVAYPYTSFTTLDRFTMLAGGTVTSYGWNIENNEMPYLYEVFNNVEKYPVSVGAVDQNGTLVPIHVYTYTAQDFI